MSERTDTPQGNGTVSQLSPLAHFARYGFPGLVTGVLLIAALWGSKIALERHLKHVDTLDTAVVAIKDSMLEMAHAQAATARAVEGIINQQGVDAATKAKKK